MTLFEKSAYDYLEQLDLSYLQRYMCAEQYTLPRWSAEDGNVAVKLYKRFLYLMIKYRQQIMLVPTKEIDEVWHNHILHTKQYHQDCEHLFGEYLHHMPSDLTQEDTDRLAKLFQQTRELYLQEFGEPLPFYQHD